MKLEPNLTTGHPDVDCASRGVEHGSPLSNRPAPGSIPDVCNHTCRPRGDHHQDDWLTLPNYLHL